MGTPVQLSEARKARRNRGSSNGKPLIDYQLADLGKRLKELTVQRDEINAEIRAIQFEQDCRCAEIQAEKHLDWIDMGDHRMVVSGNPYRNNPSEHQAEILNGFAAALEIAPRGLLTTLYELAVAARCQFTTWTSAYGEDLETAYRRRIAEMDEREAAS